VQAPVQVLGKTEQRVAHVVRVVKEASPKRLTYDQLAKKTGSSYDVLLYILQTLVEVGLVDRHDEPGHGPGRPKCFFQWLGEGAQESGS